MHPLGDLAAYLAGTLEQDPYLMVSGGAFAIAVRLAAADLISAARREAAGEPADPEGDADPSADW